MTNFRNGAALLVLGAIVGSCTTVVMHRPTMAFAAPPSVMNMSSGSMTAKSAGDREMNAAMDRMSSQMSTSKLTGVQDRDFMIMMIPHHLSAVEMAKIELRRGTHPELEALARDIIRSQDGEIARMHAWLEKWYGRDR